MSNGKPIEKKGGGPAFASPMSQIVASPGSEVDHGSPGMTLRDWFAGQAMAAMIANGIDQTFAKLCNVKQEKATAHYAYEIADSMIAERDKE